VHHGNGTEDILLDRPGLEFFSVHQHPAYPYTGAANRGRNCFQLSGRAGASREVYRAALTQALDDLKHFRQTSWRCPRDLTRMRAIRWRTGHCSRRIFYGSGSHCES